MCKGRKRLTSQERQREVRTLAAAQRRVVKQTEARLTPDERQRIEKREIAVNKITVHSQSLSESETNSQGKGPVNKRRRSKKRQAAVKKVSIRSESSSESEISSHGGPSNLEKGKGVGPRNWGDLSDASNIDLEEQQTIMESCKLAKELAHLPDEDDLDRQQLDDHESIKRTNKNSDPLVGEGKVAPAAQKIVSGKEKLQGSVNKGKGRTDDAAPNPIKTLVNNAVLQKTRCTERAATPRAMEPIEQINPKSYIGRAFQRMGKGKIVPTL